MRANRGGTRNLLRGVILHSEVPEVHIISGIGPQQGCRGCTAAHCDWTSQFPGKVQGGPIRIHEIADGDRTHTSADFALRAFTNQWTVSWLSQNLHTGFCEPNVCVRNLRAGNFIRFLQPNLKLVNTRRQPAQLCQWARVTAADANEIWLCGGGSAWQNDSETGVMLIKRV